VSVKRRPVVLKSREKVLEAIELFGTIMGNNGAVVSVIDTDFNLLYVNYRGKDNFRELHEKGANPLDMKCHEFFRKSAAVCPECRTAKVRETLRASGAYTHSNTLVDKVFEVNAYPINERIGGVVTATAIIEVARDITSDYLAGGLVHDANNILTTVLGHVSLAKNIFDKTGDALRNIQLADAAGDRVYEIMADLQNVFSGKKKWSQLTRGSTDLYSVLESTLDLMKLEYANRNIDLVRELQEVPEISANRKGLRGVFENMLINARDALVHTPNPCVTVRLYHEPLPKGGYIHVEFEDNGPGIKPEHIKRIWDPKFSTKESKGFHYGLAISKIIVERHKGQIYVDSQYGHGARFEILLPDATRLLEIHGIKKDKPTSEN